MKKEENNSGYAICVINENKTKLLVKEIKGVEKNTEDFIQEYLVETGNQELFEVEEIEKIKTIPTDSLIIVSIKVISEKTSSMYEEYEVYLVPTDVIVIFNGYKKIWSEEIEGELKLYKMPEATEIEIWETFYEEELEIEEKKEVYKPKFFG